MLDASTLVKENFMVSSPGGQNAASVTHVQYLPFEKQLKIHLDSDDITGAGPYKVTSLGVADCYGNNADFVELAHLEPMSECELYDMSIQSIYFRASDSICILQPRTENFETIIRIVNSSHLTKHKKLIIYCENSEGIERQLFEVDVKLNGNTMQEIIHKTAVTNGEKVYAVLE